jgi:hypothetical protein
MGGIDRSDDIIYLCYLNMIMTMFRITAQDIKYGDKKVIRSARKFLHSKWFFEICDYTNLDPISTRKIIQKGSKVSSRNSYE